MSSSIDDLRDVDEEEDEVDDGTLTLVLCNILEGELIVKAETMGRAAMAAATPKANTVAAKAPTRMIKDDDVLRVRLDMRNQIGPWG